MSEHAKAIARPHFRLWAMAIAAALIGAMAGSGISPAWAAGQAPGRVIRFGADFTEPPGQVIIDGRMSGSDYELCNALAKRMGAAAHWTNIDFGTLIAAIGAGRIDAACSSVDITPAREAVVNFVPYRIDSEGAAVQHGNPKHVSAPADMCGLNAAELLGSVYQTVVEEQSKACVKAGRKPIDLKTFNTTADAFAQLLNGRADIVVGDAPIMAYYVAKEPAKTAMAFQGVKPKGVGIALSKQNGALEQELKAALKELQTDGTYAKILAKWNLQSEALKP